MFVSGPLGRVMPTSIVTWILGATGVTLSFKPGPSFALPRPGLVFGRGGKGVGLWGGAACSGY